jgi:hypothetical protein
MARRFAGLKHLSFVSRYSDENPTEARSYRSIIIGEKVGDDV